MPTWNRSVNPISSTTGPTTVITATSIRAPRNMYRTTWSAMTTWMTMATGARKAITDMSGSPTWKWVGLRIVKAIGPGSTPGDKPGSMTLRGATPRYTTDAGSASGAAGVGLQGPWKC